MLSISPVYNEEFQEMEKVIALDQEEYIPLIVLPVLNLNNPVLARWQFTEEERKLVAEGADLIVCELCFGNPYTPIGLEIVPKNVQPNMIDLKKIYFNEDGSVVNDN